MFGGFEAALAFLMFVMPGLLLIGGYYGGLGRPQTLSESALHTLAQAIAWSLVILILPTLCVASDLAAWIRADEVDKNLTRLFLLGYATLFLPFVVGWGIGWLAKGHPRITKLLGSGTAWGSVAERRREAHVRVSFTDSSSPIEGRLQLSESKFAPGGSLTLNVHTGAAKHDVVLSSDQVRKVEFLGA